MPAAAIIDTAVFYEVHDAVAATIFSKTIPLNVAGVVRLTVMAGRASTGDHRTWTKSVPFSRAGGSLTIGTVSDLTTVTGSAGSSTWSITAVASGNDIQIQVTGQSLADTSWYVILEGVAVTLLT